MSLVGGMFRQAGIDRFGGTVIRKVLGMHDGESGEEGSAGMVVIVWVRIEVMSSGKIGRDGPCRETQW